VRSSSATSPTRPHQPARSSSSGTQTCFVRQK
jgi:hypothetical protein